MKPGDIYVKRSHFSKKDEPILEIWQYISNGKADFIGHLDNPFADTYESKLEIKDKITYLLNETSGWIEEFKEILVKFFEEYLLPEDSEKTLSEMGLDFSELSVCLKESLKSFRFIHRDNAFWPQDKKGIGYSFQKSSWHLNSGLMDGKEYLFGRKNEIVKISLNSSIRFIQGIFPVFRDSEICGLLKHYYYGHA